MDVPESNEVKSFYAHRVRETNVLAYILFGPAIAAKLAIIVMVVTHRGFAFIPYIIVGMICIFFVAGYYKYGWRGPVIVASVLCLAAVFITSAFVLTNWLLMQL